MPSKLVRDRIPEIIQREGKTPHTRIASQSEMHALLIAKLHEEVAEYAQNHSVEELADIQEVIEAILAERHVSLAEFTRLKQQKQQLKGAFTKRIVLERDN